MSHLKISRLQQTANAVADAHSDGSWKFSVTPTEDDAGVSRSGKQVSITVPATNSSMSDEQISQARGHVYRSVLRYTDGSDALINSKDTSDIKKNVFKMAEAARLEHLGAKRYRGDRSDFAGEVVRHSQVQQQAYAGEIDDDMAKLLAVNAASIEGRRDFSPEAYSASKPVFDEMPASVRSYYDELAKNNLLNFANDTSPEGS